jgi:hypothetical protein
MFTFLKSAWKYGSFDTHIDLLTFLEPKMLFSQEMAKYKENIFCSLILEFLPQFKSVWSMLKFQNHWTLILTLTLFSNVKEIVSWDKEGVLVIIVRSWELLFA